MGEGQGDPDFIGTPSKFPSSQESGSPALHMEDGAVWLAYFRTASFSKFPLTMGLGSILNQSSTMVV